jgi:hypothetical protein
MWYRSVYIYTMAPPVMLIMPTRWEGPKAVRIFTRVLPELLLKNSRVPIISTRHLANMGRFRLNKL